MSLRRLVLVVSALALLVGVLPAGAAVSPAGSVRPPAGLPVADTGDWVETDWGYAAPDLELPADGDWPTVLTKEGYAGASRPAPNAYLRMDDGVLVSLRIRFGEGPRGDYAFVQASIRGTNCSGGQFRLYDRRHAWDGHHIVEWIAEQPWSNGNVGMFGSSYPGQTAYYVAATQPPSLKAVMPSLLHADIYRDIFMPGGVQNYVFPVLWTYAAGPHRLPQAAFQGGSIPGDPICTEHQATRFSAGNPPDVQDEALWQAVQPTDNEWMRSRAATSYAPLIRIPYYQQHNWHDQQTGPRAVTLFNHIHPDPVTVRVPGGPECDAPRGPALPPHCVKEVVPKRFVLSNGSHGFGGYAGRDRWGWFDVFLLDRPDEHGLLDDQVVNYFEARSDGSATAVKRGQAWPFEDTAWRWLHLGPDGTLGGGEPTAEGSDTYLSVQGRQSWFFESRDTGRQLHGPDGPDQLLYVSEPLAEETAVAGPILLELWASLAGTDADVFVSLHDLRPDGEVEYLQRGMLKLSHAEVDERRSLYREIDGERQLVQPWRPHTDPDPVIPDDIARYDVEVWPVGHIFREGHRIALKVHTPPALDGLWGYTPTHNQPAAVTVHRSPDYPSRLLLPVVEPDEQLGEPWTECPVPRGFPCAQ
jgi:uncharacterized protein